MINIPSFQSYNGVIAVCGASNISEENYHLAEQLGQEIAKKQYILICGGLEGTMEAVCKGVKSQKGFTIGILPGYEKSQANKYVDLIIPSGIGEARNFILVSSADGIITLSGGAGTLSEIAFAWRLKKPIVSLSTSGGWSQKLAGTRIDESRKEKIQGAKTPKKAVEQLIELMRVI
ncbi:TIGR00725 family protein [Candidatus Lokiarchaeum ossiferum]|uniref:TIGR00725 family protein n=1 Tax=Candidatus Lokiarchaeum ossiferum TaxID=2951803 RepID=UPI00352F77ED